MFITRFFKINKLADKKFPNRFGICTLSLILAFALFVRFYNFPTRINFGPEQALSLEVAAQNLNKPSLQGLVYLDRGTSEGHILFASPFFSYSLIPLEKIFNFNPVPITAYFALLNVATGILLFFLVNRTFNFRTALFSLVLFLFNSYMIYHSMFIWILNYLPLVGVLTFYLLYKLKFSNQIKIALFLGVLSGLGIGLQYFYVLTALFVGVLIFLLAKSRLRILSLYILGCAVGNFPMVVFDLKHHFYNSLTLYKYIIDTLHNPGQSQVSYYHFLNFWPLLAFLGGLIVDFFYLRFIRFKNIYLRFLGYVFIVAVIVSYVIFNLTSKMVSFTDAVGMSAGFNIIKLDAAARAISLDNPGKNFNVAMLLDFDSQAHPLRYLLNYRYRLTPMGIEHYSGVNALYVIASSNYDFSKALAWEVRTFTPFRVHILKEIDKNYFVYKLVKN